MSLTGITSTAQEWKAFLAKTLSGALAAPPTLFKKVLFRLVNTSRPDPGRRKKINLNFCVYTSLWRLKRFDEGL